MARLHCFCQRLVRNRAVKMTAFRIMYGAPEITYFFEMPPGYSAVQTSGTGTPACASSIR